MLTLLREGEPGNEETGGRKCSRRETTRTQKRQQGNIESECGVLASHKAICLLVTYKEKQP